MWPPGTTLNILKIRIWFRWLLRNFKQAAAPSGHGVLSLCHGCGSDAIAAAQEGMDCLGIDSDETMCKYASRRIEEFFKAEQLLADACKDGERDYEGLVKFAESLNEAKAAAEAVKIEALKKILSNVKGAVYTSSIITNKVERDIVWSTLQLYYRFVSVASVRLL